MPFQVYVSCEECGNAEKVPQVGATPAGWVQMRYLSVVISENKSIVVCSPKCGIAHLGKLAREQMNNDDS